MKIKLLSLLASLLLLPLVSYADCDGRKECSMHRTHKQEQAPHCPIAGKFMQCSGLLLGNAAEIGLSDDQVKSIQQLKNDMIKRGILGKAGMEVFMIDMQSKLAEEKLDVDGIGKMIDEGTKIMSEDAKASLSALSKLKEIVKPEQMKKCKEICKKGCQK